jgi:hypothetical protein
MVRLAAGGLLVPSAAIAAPLDTNLVANPGFENVDTVNVSAAYSAPRILDWIPLSSLLPFAYSHDGSLSGNPPVAVPDYANGAPLASGGHWYFAPGNSGIDTPAEAIIQNIDVSTGDSAASIASGLAGFSLSAYFNRYINQPDHSFLKADFLNSSSVVLGSSSTVTSGPGALPEWMQFSTDGQIPIGTTTVRVSLHGNNLNMVGSNDGYTDNVDFRVTNALDVLVYLEVNTTTGEVKIRNQTGQTVNIDYYEITSGADPDNPDGHSLDPVGWNSLQDPSGNPAGFPSGNGTGNGWEEAGGSDASTLSESFLTGSSAIVDGASISLGSAFDVGDPTNLKFRYGALLDVAPPPAGDYNGDNVVNAADYAVWRDTNINGPGGYTTWRQNFGLSGGPAGESTLVTSFVHFVTSGSGSSAVPEPSCLLLAGLGLTLAAVGLKRVE